MQRAKRKYVPDLVKQSAICETNYARLRRLLPTGQKQREYRVDWHRCDYRVSIRMDEEFAYTSTLVVSYWPESATPWFNPQTFVVRLYHDARMAEVVCLQKRKQLDGRYEYPNPQMHQPDEKFQLNQHLAEWLSHCLASGETLLPVSVAG